MRSEASQSSLCKVRGGQDPTLTLPFVRGGDKQLPSVNGAGLAPPPCEGGGWEGVQPRLFQIALFEVFAQPLGIERLTGRAANELVRAVQAAL